MTKAEYWKKAFNKVVGYWYSKARPNMDMVELLMTEERRCQNACDLVEEDGREAAFKICKLIMEQMPNQVMEKLECPNEFKRDLFIALNISGEQWMGH